MKEAVKDLLIPLMGCTAIALIFIFIVWGGSYEHHIIDEKGMQSSASKDIGGYAVIRPTGECDNSFFPVCGFDGKTYDNSCKAVTAGTKVAHRGVCQG